LCFFRRARFLLEMPPGRSAQIIVCLPRVLCYSTRGYTSSQV
jgi:hypothetical protein